MPNRQEAEAREKFLILEVYFLVGSGVQKPETTPGSVTWGTEPLTAQGTQDTLHSVGAAVRQRAGSRHEGDAGL